MTRSNHIVKMTRTNIRRAVAFLGCGTLAAGLALSGAPAATAVPTVSPSPSTFTLTPAEAAVLGKDDVRQHEYWLTDYRIVDAWKESTGSGVTVAVIDTGVDGTHPDLANNVLEGYDASGEGSANGWKGLGVEPMHGTEVASLIAGHGHNVPGIPKIEGQPGKPAGVIGVAPDAKILPISLNMVSNAEKSIDEQIPAAVRYAVDHGAQIINLSIGSNKTTWPKSWDDAFAYAEEKGVLVVASAGNRGSGITQVGAPATIPGVLTVGGVDRQREASKGSSTQGISIAVTAPSTDMIAAAPGNKYMMWSGSSASAPLVSGLAALIKSKYPNLSASQIIQRIISSADDTGAVGRDPVYGFGIVNPLMALNPSTEQDAAENPLGSLKAWIAVHRRHEAPEPAPADASETPVHEEGETIVKAKIPDPSRPVEDRGFLPFIIVGALFVILGLLTARSIHRLHRLHVHVRDVVPRSHARERARETASKSSASAAAITATAVPADLVVQTPTPESPAADTPAAPASNSQAQGAVSPASGTPSPAPGGSAVPPSADAPPTPNAQPENAQTPGAEPPLRTEQQPAQPVAPQISAASENASQHPEAQGVPEQHSEQKQASPWNQDSETSTTAQSGGASVPAPQGSASNGSSAAQRKVSESAQESAQHTPPPSPGKTARKPPQQGGARQHPRRIGRTPVPRKPRLPHIAGIKRQVPVTGVPDVPADAGTGNSGSAKKPAAQSPQRRMSASHHTGSSRKSQQSVTAQRKKTAQARRSRSLGTASGRSSLPAAPDSGIPEPSAGHEVTPQEPNSPRHGKN